MLFRKEFLLNLVFYLFAAALVATRIVLLLELNVKHVDSDQPFMWQGAVDYAQNLFYEPRFYGQNYNTFMEGLFAVPLLWLDVPVYYAVPIATHLIFLFPVLFTAFYLFAKKKKANAILFLAAILCLPLGYDVLNGIPRGFVTGMFFTSFLIVSLFNPENKNYVLLNMVFTAIGFFANPNVALVSAPVMFYLFLHNYKNKWFYFYALVTLLLMLLLNWLFNGFYTKHPDYVLLAINYHISPEYFFQNIVDLDSVFGHVSYFFEGKSFAILIVLFVFPFLMWRYNKKAAWAFLFFLLIVVLSFFSGKTREGGNWPFYSFSRMYLGIPIFVALFSSFIVLRRNWLMPLCVSLTLCFSVFKALTFRSTLDGYLDSNKWLGVRLIKMDDIMNSVTFYRDQCKAHNVNHLVVSNVFWLNTYVVNGGPALFADYPITMDSKAERRYWIREELKHKVVERFIFISAKREIDPLMKTDKFEVEDLDGYGMLLIKNNKATMEEFLILARKS